MQLNLDSFFSHLIFVPRIAETKKERIIATVASIACGLFSGGLCHLVCAIRKEIIYKRELKKDGDHKVVKVSTHALEKPTHAEGIQESAIIEMPQSTSSASIIESDKITLSFKTFFSHLIFNPCLAKTKKEQIIATVASIACAILFGGLCHLICAVRKCLISKKRVTTQKNNKIPPVATLIEQPSTQENFISLKSKVNSNKISDVTINGIKVPVFQIKVCDQTSIRNGNEKCGYHALKNAFVTLGVVDDLFSPSDFKSKDFYLNLMKVFNEVEPEDPRDMMEVQAKSTIENLLQLDHSVERPLLFKNVLSIIQKHQASLSFFTSHHESLALLGCIGQSNFRNFSDILRFIEVNQKLKSTQPFRHIFVSNQLKTSNSGHWSTLILERDLQGKLCLYGMDSWHNENWFLEKLASTITKTFNKMSNEQDEVIFIKQWYDQTISGEIFNKEQPTTDNSRLSYLMKVEHAIDFMEKAGWLKHPENYMEEINAIKRMVNLCKVDKFAENPIIIKTLNKFAEYGIV